MHQRQANIHTCLHFELPPLDYPLQSVDDCDTCSFVVGLAIGGILKLCCRLSILAVPELISHPLFTKVLVQLSIGLVHIVAVYIHYKRHAASWLQSIGVTWLYELLGSQQQLLKCCWPLHPPVVLLKYLLLFPN